MEESCLQGNSCHAIHLQNMTQVCTRHVFVLNAHIDIHLTTCARQSCLVNNFDFLDAEVKKSKILLRWWLILTATSYIVPCKLKLHHNHSYCTIIGPNCNKRDTLYHHIQFAIPVQCFKNAFKFQILDTGIMYWAILRHLCEPAINTIDIGSLVGDVCLKRIELT